MEGYFSRTHSMEGGEVCVSDGGGVIFKWEGCPMGDICFDGRFSKKIVGWRGACPPHYGRNPVYCIYLHTFTTKGSKMLILGWAWEQKRLTSLVKSFT